MPHTAALLLSILSVGPSQLQLEQPAVRHLEHGVTAVLASQTDAVPGWPWERGQLSPVPNLGGVIALSLLRWYETNPDPATWLTLVQYAHYLRGFYGPDNVLPYKADIEFLARVGEAGLDRNATPLARRLFGRVQRTSPTGADEYQRISDGRAAIPEIIGYDIALSIRAALAVGDTTYAAQLADAAIQAGDLELNDGNDSYEVTSVGALAQAIACMERPGDAPALRAAAKRLVAVRRQNGAWAVNNTQATAYAVLGLSAVSGVDGARQAADAGRQWLTRRQLRSGAWAAYHDGLPEPFVGPVIPLVEAEAVTAVLTSQ